GVGPRLRPTVLNGWLQGVYDGAADALWTVDAPATPPGPRSCAEAALDAAAAAPVCPGSEDRAAPTPGAGAASRGLRHPGGHRAGARSPGLADQHCVH